LGQPRDGEAVQWVMLMHRGACMNSFFHLFLDDYRCVGLKFHVIDPALQAPVVLSQL
jgi:hypothetical protein